MKKTKSITKTPAPTAAPAIDMDDNTKERIRMIADKIDLAAKAPKYVTDDEGKVDHADNTPYGWVGTFESIGTGNLAFLNRVVNQLAGLGGDAETLSSALGFMHAQKPADEVEGLLLAQMFVANELALKFGGHANRLTDADLIDRNVNRFRKLSLTFTEHLAALNKHRGKHQQKMTVEHVHVHSGGQAIVGNIETGGGVNGKIK